MSYKVFTPAPIRTSIPPVPEKGVTLSPPPAHEIDARKSVLQRLMPIAIIGGMGLMMVVMMTMRSSGAGAGASIMSGMGAGMMMPMMMMLPMLMMRMGQSGQDGGGKSDADIDKDRKKNTLELNQARKVAHGIGEAMHNITVKTMPNPVAMPNLIDSRHDTLWSVTPDNDTESNDSPDPESPDPLPLHPMLHARIGVGPIALNPAIDPGEVTDIIDTREPVIATQNANFITVNGMVQECPISMDLSEPAYSITRGDDEFGRYALTRTMLLSLAYAHSPSVVHIAVIASKETAHLWDWVKWLPHNENTFTDPDTVTRHGYPPLFFTDMASGVKKLLDYRVEAEAKNSHIVVVVDTPGMETRISEDLISTPSDAGARVFNEDGSTMGLEDITFLVVGGHDDGLVDPTRRIAVDSPGEVRNFNIAVPVRGDDTTIDTAKLVARHLSNIRPAGFGKRTTIQDDAVDNTPVDIDAPTLMDVVGVDDLGEYDLSGKWTADDASGNENMDAPIGFEVDDQRYKPTGKIINLNFLQHVSGGTGPHGLFQGGTGSGKSFLIKCIILLMMLTHSPRKMVFILADFKGGATFNAFEGMPHVLAVISNLKDSVDMVERTKAALEGEIVRREELLKRWGVEDYLEYNQKKRDNPHLGMEDLPALVFVADEFREFVTSEKGQAYKSMFNSLSAKGRSLRMHLLLGSQFMEQQMLGESLNNFDYGISLKVGTAAYSNTVIKSPLAASLPPNRVGILYRQDLQDSIRERFQGFNHKLPYIPGASSHAIIEEHANATGTEDTTADVISFNSAGEFIRDVSGDPNTTDDEVTVIDHDTGEQTSESSTKRLDQFTAVRDMIVKKGSNYTTPRSLWAEPMSTPMSFADIPDDYWGTIPDGTLRIGDIDVPFDHTRVPMTVDLTGSGSSTMIYGDRGTGRSTAVKAMIASSAMRHTGNRIGWLIYDYAGTSLSDMETWPNVAAYATRNDGDMWTRIRGEIDRILALRESVWSAARPNSVSDYIEHKSDLGVADDPYGRLVVVVDGFGDWIESVKQSDPDQITWLTRIITDGRQYGIHIVATKSATDSYKSDELAGKFDHKIVLKHNDRNTTPFKGMGIRDLMDTIPAAMPGRVADGSVTSPTGETLWHHGRILVPVAHRIERDDNNQFDHHRDHSSAIRDLGAKITDLHARQMPGTTVDKLTAPSGTVTVEQMRGAVAERNPNVISGVALEPRKRKIALGISIDTGRAYFQDLEDKAQSKHMVISGAAGKGSTTLIRTHITSVMDTFSSDEARIIILDGGGGTLIDLQQQAVAGGYMKPTNFVMNRRSLPKVTEMLEHIISTRMPDEDALLNDPTLKKTRGYFSGPEVFVYVDKYPSFEQQGNQAGLEKLMRLLETGTDVGVHFIVSDTDANITNHNMMSKFIAPLLSDHPTMLALLSSTYRGGSPAYGAKFRSLPMGRVRMVNSSGVESQVQFANAEAAE